MKKYKVEIKGTIKTHDNILAKNLIFNVQDALPFVDENIINVDIEDIIFNLLESEA